MITTPMDREWMGPNRCPRSAKSLELPKNWWAKLGKKWKRKTKRLRGSWRCEADSVNNGFNGTLPVFYESVVASVQSFMLQLLCGLERKCESWRSDEGRRSTAELSWEGGRPSHDCYWCPTAADWFRFSFTTCCYTPFFKGRVALRLRPAIPHVSGL